MKRRMKMGLALGLSAAMLFSVAGCGSSDSGKSGSDTIRVAIWDNNQLAGLQEIASEWSKESGQQVEFQVLDWSSYWTMLEAGVSGGEMPDVFWMHSNYATKYMESDVLLNLNDYIAGDEAIDLDNYFEGITETMIPLQSSTTRQFLTSMAWDILQMTGPGRILLRLLRRSPIKVQKTAFTEPIATQTVPRIFGTISSIPTVEK